MPTNRRPGTREEREAERKAAELERRREAEAARLAEYNRRVQASASVQRSTKPGRIVSKARPVPPVPIDLEAGRYRAARPLPGRRPSIGTVMPDGVADRFGPMLRCDHCGHPMLSYSGRGAYHCSERRLAQSKHQTSGCGRYSYGPYNAGEVPYNDKECEYLEDPDLLPM